MKNLLHLGEDRYLTTLLLKYFSNYKTQFVRDAHAYTVVPDEWSVLLSQRRRWINSTIHNLAELVFLDRLCGFCCFSMRFIVFIDLLSTVTQPVTVAYVSIPWELLCLFYSLTMSRLCTSFTWSSVKENQSQRSRLSYSRQFMVSKHSSSSSGASGI